MPPTNEQVSAQELEQLRKRNAELEAANSRLGADEKIIRKKMAAGLTREQAVAAIEHQRKFDEKSKEIAAKRKKK